MGDPISIPTVHLRSFGSSKSRSLRLSTPLPTMPARLTYENLVAAPCASRPRASLSRSRGRLPRSAQLRNSTFKQGLRFSASNFFNIPMRVRSRTATTPPWNEEWETEESRGVGSCSHSSSNGSRAPHARPPSTETLERPPGCSRRIRISRSASRRRLVLMSYRNPGDFSWRNRHRRTQQSPSHIL